MATGNVVVNVVDVGQGQCTFVEIYDTAGTTLLHTLLFDCGSDKQSDETQTNLQYIADKVNSMPKPTFDCVFFSHSDSDHISLMFDLLWKFPFGKNPAIKKVWYGGARAKYAKGKAQFNILNYLQTAGYCPASAIKGFTSNSTNYDNTSHAYVGNLWTSADGSVVVRAIAANVLSDDPDWDDNSPITAGTTAEALNRVSLVAGLYYAGGCYVICGDATNQTMAAINLLFQAGTTAFDKNFMTTLPHHGSRATGLAVPSAYIASDEAVKVVDTFAAILKSKSLTASAYQKHKHPSLELMSHFPAGAASPLIKDPRLNAANSHWLVAWNDLDLDLQITAKKRKALDSQIYYTIETTSNTFTTNYSQADATFTAEIAPALLTTSTVPAASGVKTPPINLFASWVYTTKATGETSLQGRVNLSTAAFTQAGTPITLSALSAASVPGGVRARVEFLATGALARSTLSRPGPLLLGLRPPASSPRRFVRNLRTLR